jgi:hypothetical protein
VPEQDRLRKVRRVSQAVEPTRRDTSHAHARNFQIALDGSRRDTQVVGNLVRRSAPPEELQLGRS